MNPNCYTKQKERALNRKIELIKLKGGKCERCGYDKNISALEFHHINPENKCFQLDSRHLSNTTRERVLEEVQKCILVCANCHREIHHPILEKDNINNILVETRNNHTSIFHTKKKGICKYCGKEFDYFKGKLYCSKECREKDKGYPSYKEIEDKYKELGSWEKVAKHFGITRKITQNIRKNNRACIGSAS